MITERADAQMNARVIFVTVQEKPVVLIFVSPGARVLGNASVRMDALYVMQREQLVVMTNANMVAISQVGYVVVKHRARPINAVRQGKSVNVKLTALADQCVQLLPVSARAFRSANMDVIRMVPVMLLVKINNVERMKSVRKENV